METQFGASTGDRFEVTCFVPIGASVVLVPSHWCRGRKVVAGLFAAVGLVWLAQPYVMSAMLATAVTGGAVVH